MTLNELPGLSLGVEERRDEAPSERPGAAPGRPDPEVVAKPKRRRFTAEYRLRILEAADRCTEPGEAGRLLRREGACTALIWQPGARRGVAERFAD